MRRLFSNLIVILLGLLGAIAKWGGLVMDVIGLSEAGSQLDKWISQLEIGDGAYILIFVSVVLLLIINGPVIRRAVLKPKPRTYDIEELQELSGVLGVAGETQKETGTYVKLKMDGPLYEFIDANNVIDITDHGTGDISINFEVPLNLETMIVDVAVAEGSIDYNVVERMANSVRLRFHGYEPSVVRIKVED